MTFVWLLEFFEHTGNSTGIYFTGRFFNENPIGTRNVDKAFKYTTIMGAARMSYIKSSGGVWRIVEHGFESLEGQDESVNEQPNEAFASNKPDATQAGAVG